MLTNILLMTCFIVSFSTVFGKVHDYTIVSTTEQPSSHLKKSEKLQEGSNSNIDEISRRLEQLESQNARILEILQVPNLITPQLLINFQSQDLPTNCKDIQNRGYNSSNVYLVKPKLSPNVFAVWCDMENRGGGWTYLLNRFNGSQEFAGFDWKEYQEGFGDLGGEFWLGLENIHYLTGYEVNELLVELVDWNGTKVFARYDGFSIGSENEGYIMKLLTGYNGTAGDSLTYSAKMKFSTKSKDQDRWSRNCAQNFGAGWWYNDCMGCLLTGKYMKGITRGKQAQMMYWNKFRGTNYGLKEARMMVRPRDTKHAL